MKPKKLVTPRAVVRVIAKVNFAYNRPWRPRGGAELWFYPFFNLGARWRWVVNAVPQPLTPGKETRYPLCGRLGGPQSRSGRVRKIAHPPGFVSQAVQPVASCYTDPHVFRDISCLYDFDSLSTKMSSRFIPLSSCPFLLLIITEKEQWENHNRRKLSSLEEGI